jgi:hypothetical protein
MSAKETNLHSGDRAAAAASPTSLTVLRKIGVAGEIPQ